MKHIILEIYCIQEPDETRPKHDCPCSSDRGKLSADCFTNGPNSQRCPNLYFTPAGHEIAYSEKDGTIEWDSWIGFGGDMEISGQDTNKLVEMWSNICRAKIDEAYLAYKSATAKLDRTDS